MKKVFFVCILIMFSVVLAKAQNATNKTDADGKKQGLWEEKSPSGSSKGVYVSDARDGCWTSYSSEGKLIRIENFKKGIRDGISVEIDPRGGYLMSETYFANDLIEGTAKKYFYGTNPASLIDYVDGKMNGKKRIYYENSAGKLLEESEYKDDAKSGTSVYYSMNGEPIAEYNYVNNMLQGVQKAYYPGKKLMSQQEFKDNIENGPSKEYYENGNLKSEGNYSKGILNGLWKEYNEDGSVRLQGLYLNGLKEGKWQEYNAAGKVIKTTTFSKGQAQ